MFVLPKMKHMRAASLLAASLAFAAPTLAHAVTSTPTCQALEQQCEKFAERTAKTVASTRKDQVAAQKDDDLTQSYCFSAYDQALKTGFWPAWRSTPPIPCHK